MILMVMMRRLATIMVVFLFKKILLQNLFFFLKSYIDGRIRPILLNRFKVPKADTFEACVQPIDGCMWAGGGEGGCPLLWLSTGSAHTVHGNRYFSLLLGSL